MNDGNLINVRNLTRRFGTLTAVDGISFDVRQGDVFAFLGPNGAGKSTTIRMLITLLAPTAGSASVDGLDIVRNSAEVRRKIGYVPQLISVDGTLTAFENLVLMARLYDIPRRECETRAREVLAFLALEDHHDALVRTFSGGMIRRLEIGQAILHRPKALFLDEPTSGLDPVARQNVWEHILELRKTYGTTIFFSTHQMEEADAASDTVAIMNRGKIAVIGTPQEIKARTGNPDATLEDAFIFLTGTNLSERGSFRETRRSRQVERRLG
ncbi:MAG TPA: ATP-binding cassette domain-containing protein [Bacteroidota bacterium]|nr:ATP-binding cassette domain-containing protein [Bacteroidota bacterium]